MFIDTLFMLTSIPHLAPRSQAVPPQNCYPSLLYSGFTYTDSPHSCPVSVYSSGLSSWIPGHVMCSLIGRTREEGVRSTTRSWPTTRNQGTTNRFLHPIQDGCFRGFFISTSKELLTSRKRLVDLKDVNSRKVEHGFVMS